MVFSLSQTLNSQLDAEFLDNYLSILSQTGVNIFLGNPTTSLKKQELFSERLYPSVFKFKKRNPPEPTY